MPKKHRVPDTSTSNEQITFCDFDRVCRVIAEHSWLKYNHREVVLVCKILRHWDTHGGNERLQKIRDHNIQHFCDADTDASVQVTLVWCNVCVCVCVNVRECERV